MRADEDIGGVKCSAPPTNGWCVALAGIRVRPVAAPTLERQGPITRPGRRGIARRVGAAVAVGQIEFRADSDRPAATSQASFPSRDRRQDSGEDGDCRCLSIEALDVATSTLVFPANELDRVVCALWC